MKRVHVALAEFAEFLYQRNYTDCDIWAEEPRAVDAFIDEYKIPLTDPAKIVYICSPLRGNYAENIMKCMATESNGKIGCKRYMI